MYTTLTHKHLYSPLGDSRERAVRCIKCNAETWNICACCDKHCEHGTMEVPSQRKES